MASPAAGHDYWLELSSYRPAAGERVTVSHRVGERWVGDPAPRYPPAIVRFELIEPDGSTVAVPGVTGADPAGFFAVRKAGSQEVVYQSHNRNYLELPPAKFEEYLRLEGLEWVAAERARRGEAQANSREVFSRSAMAWLCAPPLGANAATPSANGLKLEIVPERDPCSLGPGEEIAVRVLFRGQPQLGLQVYALRADDASAPANARTDKDGRARLRLDRAGRWMIKTVQMERVEAEGAQWEWESYWSSLTLELAD